MNRIFKVIWSRTHNHYVVVSESARCCSGGASSRVACSRRAPRRALRFGALAAAVLSALMPGWATADATLPAGGRIVAGQGAITQSGSTMTVHQGTDRLITNWDSFSIGSDAAVAFVQPRADAVALNRVVGQDPSHIFGQLSANGRVFLVNPNGVLFGQGAQVDVGALVASTLQLSDTDFLADRYGFTRGTHAGDVVNQGEIRTAPGGVAALIAPVVRNEGGISAEGGTALLAAAHQVDIDMNGDGLIAYRLQGDEVSALIENSGSIVADGGLAVITAQAAQGITRAVINNTGTVRAQSLESRDGRIVLAGGRNGTVAVAGTVDASGERGGHVQITGELVALGGNGETARIDASGRSGGGTILVGGDYLGGNPEVQNAARVYVGQNASLSADALQAGNGGEVIVWSDEYTGFFGHIGARGGAASGDGGFVETSSHDVLHAFGTVAVGAPKGKGGTWLLDPQNITIQAAGADSSIGSGPDFVGDGSFSTSILTTGTLEATLNAGGNVTVTTAATGSQGGDITIASAISKTAGGEATLTFNAHRDIAIQGDIASSSDKLNLVFNADSPRAGGGAIVVARDLSTNGGSVQFGGDASYTVGTYFGGTGERTVTTSGGDVTFHGDTIVGTGLDIDTEGGSGGNVTFNGKVDAGNTYEWVTANVTWEQARDAAKSGDGDRPGDTYLVTITSALENSVVRTMSNGLSSWLGARSSGPVPDRIWRWVTGPEGLEDGGQGRAFFTQTTQSPNPGGGTSIDGQYSNWASGEPNNWSNIEDVAINGWQSVSQWNDYPSTFSRGGYVRETNLTAASLTVNTGAGNPTVVSFQKNVGDNKPMGEVAVTGGSLVFGPDVTSLRFADTWNVSTPVTFNNDVTVRAGADIVLDAPLTAVDKTLVLAAARNFINNVPGNGGLNTGTTGRYMVYSSNPADSLEGMSGYSKHYNVAYDGTVPSYAGSDNWFFYSIAPVLTPAAAGSIIYGNDESSIDLTQVSGFIDGDTVSDLSGSASFSVAGYTPTGAGFRPVGAYGVTVTGGVTDNLGYQYDFSDLFLTVLPREVAVGGGRTYDGTAVADAAHLSVFGLLTGDAASLAGNGSVVGKNVGNNDLIGLGTLALSGADAANYSISLAGSGLTITPREVLLAGGRAYDGSVIADAADFSVFDMIDGDDVTVSGSGSLAGKNAGLQALSAPGTLVLGGTDAGNYQLAGGSFMLVVPKDVVVGGSRVYDGSTAAAAADMQVFGAVTGDALSLAGSGTVAAKNVGSQALTDLGTLALGGEAAGNYNLLAAGSQLAISAKPVTVSGSRVYDGSTGAVGSDLSVDGLLGGDSVTVGGAGSVFNRNVGVNKSITSLGALALAGTDAANYALQAGGNTLTVTPRDVSVSGARAYDGSTLAQGSVLAIDGLIAGDTVTVSGSGTVADKHVGVDKAVTLGGLALGGLHATNYNLAAAGSTLTITPKTVSLSGSRVYDGVASVVAGELAIAGLVAGDALSLSGAGSLTDANAGAGKSLSLGSLALAGEDFTNYLVTGSGHSFTITPRPLAVTGTAVDSKVYDGTRSATVSQVGELSGLVGAEGFTLSTAALFDNANAGTDKPMTVAYTLQADASGALASNYTVADQVTMADVTPKVLTVSGSTAPFKVYDGTRAAQVTPGTLVGLVGSENFALGATGLFDSPEQGSNKPVTIAYNLGAGTNGALAGNYSVQDDTVTSYILPADSIMFTAAQLAGLAKVPTPVGGPSPTGDAPVVHATPMVFKLQDLTPELVGRMTPDQLRRLPDDQLSQLTPEQLAVLSPAQFKALNPAVLRWLSPEQQTALLPLAQKSGDARLVPLAVVPQPKQADKMTPDEVRASAPVDVAKWPNEAIRNMTSAQVAALTDEQLRAMTPDQLAQLSPSQIIALGNPQRLRDLSVAQRIALHAAGGQLGLASVLISPAEEFMVFPSLLQERLGALNAGIMRDLPPATIQKIAPEKMNEIPAYSWTGTTPTQAKALSPAQWAAIPSSNLEFIPVDAFKGVSLDAIPESVRAQLAPAQREALLANAVPSANNIALFSGEALRNFSDPQLNGMSAQTVQAMTQAQLAALRPEQVAALAARMSPQQLKALSPEQQDATGNRNLLSDAQRRALDDAFVKRLETMPDSEIAKLPPEFFANMTEAQWKLLSSARNGRIYAALTPQQQRLALARADQLAADRFSSMTPEQLRNLSGNDTIALSQSPKALAAALPHLSGGQLQSLPFETKKALLPKLGKEQVSALTVDEVKALPLTELSKDAVAGLGAGQLKAAMQAKGDAALSPEQWAAVSPQVLAQLPLSDAVMASMLPSLTPQQIAALPPQKLREIAPRLAADALQKLSGGQLDEMGRFLMAHQVQRLDPAQIAQVNPTLRTAMENVRNFQEPEDLGEPVAGYVPDQIAKMLGSLKDEVIGAGFDALTENSTGRTKMYATAAKMTYDVQGFVSDLKEQAETLEKAKELQAEVARLRNKLAEQAKTLGTALPAASFEPSGFAGELLADMALAARIQDDPEQVIHELMTEIYQTKAKLNMNAYQKNLNDWAGLSK